MRIAFIGGGKMAEALIARLGGQAGPAKPVKVIVSDVDNARLIYLAKKYRVKVTNDNLTAFNAADIVVLAVKPQQMGAVLEGIRYQVPGTRGQKTIISIAAGIPIKYLQKRLPGCRIVRAMPNNPALVGHGMTALAKGPGPGTWSLAPAKKIFSAVGDVALVPEKWLDAVTGLSGSGPAYVYQMIEALTDGGVKVGLPKSLAARLALQTVLGAALTVKLTGKEPAELRSMVTSPGGTTIEGLNVLGKKGFNRAIKEAIAAAARKSKILSRQWAA